MQRLARYVTKELKTANHCAVYQEELNRVWPRDGEKRANAITQFAKQHGWRVRFYKDGFCAIFDKAPGRK